MTRDEMIDQMTIVLIAWFPDEYKAYGDVSDADSRFRDVSNAILHYQETVGMLPPAVRHQYSCAPTGSNHLILETASVTYTNEWEPE